MRSYERLNEVANQLSGYVDKAIPHGLRVYASELEEQNQDLDRFVTLLTWHIQCLEAENGKNVEYDLMLAMLTRAGEYREHERYDDADALVGAVGKLLRMNMTALLDEAKEMEDRGETVDTSQFVRGRPRAPQPTGFTDSGAEAE